ncbi:MAG TPA: hypothetical protein VLG37_00900 [Candidatus Saccharimonadales bacterium]|nr:hypothetical protein [Candidatus Saccharimonadales bacterium]
MSTETLTRPYSDIDQAANKAYIEIAKAGFSPETVHREEVCLTASDLMLRELIDNGHKDTRAVERIGDIEPGHHIYLVLDTGTEELVVDPTWQQFFDPEALPADSPRVLIGTREEVVGQAAALGAPDTVLDVWRPLETAPTIVQENWRPPLKPTALAA